MKVWEYWVAIGISCRKSFHTILTFAWTQCITFAFVAFVSFMKVYFQIGFFNNKVEVDADYNETWCAYPTNIYLLKVKNRNTRKRYEIWSKLTKTKTERHLWRRFGVFIVNSEHIFLTFFYFFYCWLWTNKC